MKVLRVIDVVAQGLLVASGLSLAVTFASHGEMAGKFYLWTFAAWGVTMAVALVLLVPLRLYAWLRCCRSEPISAWCPVTISG
jgi:hypothetical protein